MPAFVSFIFAPFWLVLFQSRRSDPGAYQAHELQSPLPGFRSPWMRLAAACSVLVLVISALAASQTAEQKTARYLDSIRKQPSLLLALLHDMPKGGDLHVHLTGAIYAEDMIDWAASDNFCVDRTTSRLLGPPCDPCERYTPKPAIRCAYGDHVLYNQIIDAW